MILSERVCEILDQVPNGPSDKLENDEVEFKEYSTENALHNDKKLPEELSALSNYKGGIIVIGVKDGSNVRHADWPSQLVGFDHVDLFTTRERLRGKLKPSVDLVVEEIEHQSKNYLVIQTPRSRSSLVATASGKVCIRDGKSSRPMTPDEIEQAVKNLQDYDWSAETLDIHPLTSLDYKAFDEAKTDFASRRDSRAISHAHFLEAIGATSNGRLTKSGLLFLGRPEIIKTELGNFEYRFSRKLASGDLLINDIWQGCLWHTVKLAKQYFEACNEERRLEFGGKDYLVQLLDRVAFNEAYLNAVVHRDYSVDGMVSVNFSGDRLIITSPGLFYGGVTPENITKHEPRHRNKALARMLMEFHMVDRAGMGVLRMSVNSLRYGRDFPKFTESYDSVEVAMEASYVRAGVFVLAMNNDKRFGIPELLILNSVYERGYVSVAALKRQLSRVVDGPWDSIRDAVRNLGCVELCGNHSGIFIRVLPDWNKILEVQKSLRLSRASRKHVDLYEFLARHGSASNSDIKAHLNHKHTSQTSAFLRDASYVKRTGRGPSAVWSLAE